MVITGSVDFHPPACRHMAKRTMASCRWAGFRARFGVLFSYCSNKLKWILGGGVPHSSFQQKLASFLKSWNKTKNTLTLHHNLPLQLPSPRHCPSMWGMSSDVNAQTASRDQTSNAFQGKKRCKTGPKQLGIYNCRALKGGVLRRGGNWGTLRIPREDWE